MKLGNIFCGMSSFKSHGELWSYFCLIKSKMRVHLFDVTLFSSKYQWSYNHTTNWIEVFTMRECISKTQSLDKPNFKECSNNTLNALNPWTAEGFFKVFWGNSRAHNFEIFSKNMIFIFIYWINNHIISYVLNFDFQIVLTSFFFEILRTFWTFQDENLSSKKSYFQKIIWIINIFNIQTYLVISIYDLIL